MKYISVCSGIESASVAWHPIKWEPVAFSEIEPFPCSLLAHHYPSVPNLGDMTKFDQWPEELLAQGDILVGGTPCQAFSIAGSRNSLEDNRGNLTLIYAKLFNRIDSIRIKLQLPPSVCIWENVPGVLNTKDNAFGCFLAALSGENVSLKPPGGRWSDAGCVYGPQRAVAWRCLDAQYFDLAQRRKRVFVVAGAGEGFRPEEILFEFSGLRRDSAPSRETRQTAPETFKDSINGGTLIQPMAFEWQRGASQYLEVMEDLAPCLIKSQTGAVLHNIDEQQNCAEELMGCLKAREKGGEFESSIALSFDAGQSGNPKATFQYCEEHTAPIIKNRPNCVGGVVQVRRLTPRECERLQGFPDDYTLIPYRGKLATDSPRYKALGNSKAVPVIQWLGQRIEDYFADM